MRLAVEKVGPAHLSLGESGMRQIAAIESDRKDEATHRGPVDAHQLAALEEHLMKGRPADLGHSEITGLEDTIFEGAVGQGHFRESEIVESAAREAFASKVNAQQILIGEDHVFQVFLV